MESSKADLDSFYNIENIEEDKDEVIEIDFDFEEDYSKSKQYIFSGTYLISTVKSGLMLIHSKRAKERILYDEIMASFIVTPITSQQQLFPIEIEVKHSTIAHWEQNSKTIERLGFSYQKTENGLSFDGIPSYLNPEQTLDCIESISTKLELEQIDKGELAHEFILSIAKSSSKGSSKWNQESANHLIEQLFSCQEHQYSPSGQLILKTISSEELFQQF